MCVLFGVYRQLTEKTSFEFELSKLTKYKILFQDCRRIALIKTSIDYKQHVFQLTKYIERNVNIHSTLCSEKNA